MVSALRATTRSIAAVILERSLLRTTHDLLVAFFEVWKSRLTLRLPLCVSSRSVTVLFVGDGGLGAGKSSGEEGIDGDKLDGFVEDTVGECADGELGTDKERQLAEAKTRCGGETLAMAGVLQEWREPRRS